MFSLLQNSIPSSLIEPFVIFPGLSIKLIIAFATVDLPDPDSPTMPIISPLSRLKDTFLPASIVSFLVCYSISNSFISRKLILILILDLKRLSSNHLKD